MSGVLGFHDQTYKLLGSILRLGLGSVIWSVKTLTAQIVKSLDDSTLEQVRSKGKDPKKEIARLIYYSKQRGYLNSKLQTTVSGASKLESLNFKLLTMDEPWDKKWRIVMYDIPESKRRSRDQVRRLIKQLGFEQLQRSVWIHPLPCLNHFRKIKNKDNLDDELILIETSSIDGERDLIQHFKKLYPKL